MRGYQATKKSNQSSEPTKLAEILIVDWLIQNYCIVFCKQSFTIKKLGKQKTMITAEEGKINSSV